MSEDWGTPAEISFPLYRPSAGTVGTTIEVTGVLESAGTAILGRPGHLRIGLFVAADHSSVMLPPKQTTTIVLVESDGSYDGRIVVPTAVYGLEGGALPVTKRELSGTDRVFIVIAVPAPDGRRYGWAAHPEPFRVESFPAYTGPDPGPVQVPDDFGYSVPAVSAQALHRYIEFSVGEYGYEQNEAMFLDGNGPCLGWSEGSGQTTFEFVGDPLEVVVARTAPDLGLMTNATDAVGPVAELSTPLVSVDLTGPAYGWDLIVESRLTPHDFTVPAPIAIQRGQVARAYSRAMRIVRKYGDGTDEQCAEYAGRSSQFESVEQSLNREFGPGSESWYEQAEDLYEWDDLLMALIPNPMLPRGITEDVRESLTPWVASGLGRPFVPDEFASQLEVWGDWSWGYLDGGDGRAVAGETRIEDYSHNSAVHRFVQGDWRPRYHVCHFGHGINSYSINYSIVNNRLAIFTQAAWGGIYHHPVTSRVAVVDMATDLASIWTLAASISRWPPGRLVVIHSDFRDTASVMWQDAPGSRLRPPTRENDDGARRAPVDTSGPGRQPDGMAEAISFLEARYVSERTTEPDRPLPSG